MFQGKYRYVKIFYIVSSHEKLLERTNWLHTIDKSYHSPLRQKFSEKFLLSDFVKLLRFSAGPNFANVFTSYSLIIRLAKNYVVILVGNFHCGTLLKSTFECPVSTWLSTKWTSLWQATAISVPNMVILHVTDYFANMLITIILSWNICSLRTFEILASDKGKGALPGPKYAISCQFQTSYLIRSLVLCCSRRIW